jgi:hypothetical protein
MWNISLVVAQYEIPERFVFIARRRGPLRRLPLDASNKAVPAFNAQERLVHALGILSQMLVVLLSMANGGTS